MPVVLIAAMSEERDDPIIGQGSGMPWDVPEEYAHYLGLIRGHPVIMGRSSYAIFGDDLPDGSAIVLSRSVTELPGARVADSLDAALALGRERDELVFVAGGGRVYAQAIERADAMYLLTIKGEFEGDTVFPAFDASEWDLREEVDHGPFVFRYWARPGHDTSGLHPRSASRGASPWSRLGTVDPNSLKAHRVNLHWSAQLVGQAGRKLVDFEADDSHTNLLWNPERLGFRGREIPSGHRVALDVGALSIGLLDKGGLEVARLALAGCTLSEAFDWLNEQLGAAGNDVGGGLELPDYDLPSHPVGDGGVFAPAETEALDELARWYGNAQTVLEQVRGRYEAASEVRCWPHHFDLASLIAVDSEPEAADDAESTRSVGVGLSPGDGGYPQPYLYITPWPYPEADGLPALPGAADWHTEGWVGAVLTGSAVVAAGDATAQRRLVEAVLSAAIDASLALLDDSNRSNDG